MDVENENGYHRKAMTSNDVNSMMGILNPLRTPPKQCPIFQRVGAVSFRTNRGFHKEKPCKIESW